MASPPSLRLLSVLSAQALPPQCLSCTCILFLTVNRCPCFSHRVPPSSVLLLTLLLPSFASHVWKKSLCILSTHLFSYPTSGLKHYLQGPQSKSIPTAVLLAQLLGFSLFGCVFPASLFLPLIGSAPWALPSAPSLPLPPLSLCPLSPFASSLPLPVLLPAPQPVLRGSLWLCFLLLEQSWPHSLGSPALTPFFPCSQQNQNHFWGHSSPATCSLCLFFH